MAMNEPSLLLLLGSVMGLIVAALVVLFAQVRRLDRLLIYQRPFKIKYRGPILRVT